MVKLMKETNETLAQKADATNVAAEAESLAKCKKRGNDTVVVACGIPMGQIFNVNGKEILLKGAPLSHLVSAYQQGVFLPAGKYGLTEIAREDWEAILKNYGYCDFIQNGVIFAKEHKEAVLEEAQEKSKKRLGFEQADPKKGRTQPKENKE